MPWPRWRIWRWFTGARVVATFTAANEEFVKRLDADEVMDYRQTDFTPMNRGNAALDTIGGVRHAFVSLKPHGGLPAGIAKFANSGKLRSTFGTNPPLAEARWAYEMSLAGHTRGKIALKVN
jgi:NADPH:quinone reductase-like Zn-dependent oxidoreductase